MNHWNERITPQRIDTAAGVIQRLCLLVMIAVELLFFLPGERVDNIVYLFLEWRLVDISVLFLAASCCRKYLRQSIWYFLPALLIAAWFYLLRGVHLRLEGTNQDPGAFVCAYVLCLCFAAAAADEEKIWGLKVMASVFVLTGISFSVYALLQVMNHLPPSLDGFVFWDGCRLGIMGHPNICAAILFAGSGFSTAFFLQAKRQWVRVLLLLVTAVQFCALSLTNSRTTIILACLFFGGTVFCAVRKTGGKRRVSALIAAVAVMAVLFSVSRVLFLTNRAYLLARLGYLPMENGQGDLISDLWTLNGRTEIWAAAMRSLADYPAILLTGTERAGEIISPYWARMNVLHSHNSWVQTLFQLGLPGLLAALALTGLAAWSIIVLLRRNDCLLHSCVALLILCLMGCAMMEPYLFTVYAQFHYFDFLFMLCLGYLNQWRRQKPNGKGERKDV